MFHFPSNTVVCFFLRTLDNNTLSGVYPINHHLRCFSSVLNVISYLLMSAHLSVSHLCRKPTNGKPPKEDNCSHLADNQSPIVLFLKIFLKSFFFFLAGQFDIFFNAWLWKIPPCVSKTWVRRHNKSSAEHLKWQELKQTAGLRWQWNKMAAGLSALGNTVITTIHPPRWLTARQTLRWLMIMALWWWEGGHSQWMFTAKMLIS